MIIIISGNHCWNNTTHPDDQQKELDEHDHVFRLYYGLLALPVVSLGLLSTILFIACVLKAMKERRVSRKFYALLLNRAIGDLLAILCAAITIIFVFSVSHVSQNIVQILNTVFAGCFWSAMISYFSMGLLKLYGIARPLHYIHHITMNKCVKIVVFSWLAFFTLVTITMIFTALTKISVLADWTNCTMEKCLKPIYRVRNALTAIVYFFTIFCFLITVCLIRRANKLRKSLRQSDLSKSRSYHSSSSISTARCGSDKSILQSKHKIANKKNSKSLNFPLVKLALNVGTLAIFHFPYTVWAIFLTFAPTCYFTFHWTIMQSLMGYVRFSLLFRIVLDSCMGIWMDKQMRNSLRQILGMAAKHSSSHSSNRMSSSISESALDNRHLSVGCKIDPLRVASLRIPPKRKVWTPNSSTSAIVTIGSANNSSDVVVIAPFGSINKR